MRLVIGPISFPRRDFITVIIFPSLEGAVHFRLLEIASVQYLWLGFHDFDPPLDTCSMVIDFSLGYARLSREDGLIEEGSELLSLLCFLG